MAGYRLEVMTPDPERPAPDFTPSPAFWTTAQGRRIAYTKMAPNHLLAAYRWLVSHFNTMDNQRARNRELRHWRPAHNALIAEIARRHLQGDKGPLGTETQ